MSKFFEGIRNIRNIVKFVAFLSDALKSVVDCYERHYPESKEKEKKEVEEEK